VCEFFFFFFFGGGGGGREGGGRARDGGGGGGGWGESMVGEIMGKRVSASVDFGCYPIGKNLERNKRASIIIRDFCQ
jgi:hypothetical protein